MAQIAEVLKYEGDNMTFIWKHPSEDFNCLTQLIVHESQEAIFLMRTRPMQRRISQSSCAVMVWSMSKIPRRTGACRR